MVIYAVLKVQGEIFVELRDFHRAVQALARTCKVAQRYDQSIYYLDEALKLTWEIKD